MIYLDEIAAEIAAELGPEDLPREGDPDRLLRLYALLVRCKGPPPPPRTSTTPGRPGWPTWTPATTRSGPSPISSPT